MFSCLSRKRYSSTKLKIKTESNTKISTKIKQQSHPQSKKLQLIKPQQQNKSYTLSDQKNISSDKKPNNIDCINQITQTNNEIKSDHIRTLYQQNIEIFQQSKRKQNISQISQIPKKDIFQIDEAVSTTSFQIFLENQKQLRKQIYKLVLDLSRPLIFMPKHYQSSLEGMHKIYSYAEIDQIQNENQNQHNKQYSINLNQQFSKALILRNYEQAEKLFSSTNNTIQIGMSKNQKNNYDAKGFSPIYITTLLSIKDNQKGLQLLKKILKDKDIIPNPKIQNGFKPIQEAILFRSLPTLTNLFRASYFHKVMQVKKSLKELINILDTIPDFHIEIFVKVNSFFPLIDKIAPNDTIKIFKKGKKLRIDYSLVGYSFLQNKRRSMSCVIQQLNKQDYTILTINHDKRCYSDLLEPFQDQQLLLFIQDLISTQVKKVNPQIQKAKISPQINIFNQVIRQQTDLGIAVKHQLKVFYLSKTQKMKPNSKNITKQLQFLNDWEQYQNYKPKINLKIKQKQLNLGVWLVQKSPLSLDHLIQMMKFISFSHQSGQIVYNFLADKKIKQIFNGFPIKIQIPINFSLYLDIKFEYMNTKCPQDIQFQFIGKYIKQKRVQYQKTLIRKQKRAAIIKFYT